MEENIGKVIPEVAELSDVFADLVSAEHLQMTLLGRYHEMAGLLGGEFTLQIAKAVKEATQEAYVTERDERIARAGKLMGEIDGAPLVLFMLADRTAHNILNVASDLPDMGWIEIQPSLLAVWAAYTFVMDAYSNNQIDASGICPLCGGDATDESHNDMLVIAGPEKEEGEDANA